MKPGCRLKNAASSAQAAMRAPRSSGATVNLLTSTTGPECAPESCFNSGVVASSSSNLMDVLLQDCCSEQPFQRQLNGARPAYAVQRLSGGGGARPETAAKLCVQHR